MFYVFTVTQGYKFHYIKSNPLAGGLASHYFARMYRMYGLMRCHEVFFARLLMIFYMEI